MDAKTFFSAQIQALDIFFRMTDIGTPQGIRVNDGVLHDLAHLVNHGEKAATVFPKVIRSKYKKNLADLVDEVIYASKSDPDADEARAIASTVVLLRRLDLMEDSEVYIRACVKEAKLLSETWERIEPMVHKSLKTKATQKRADQLFKMVNELYDFVIEQQAKAS